MKKLFFFLETICVLCAALFSLESIEAIAQETQYETVKVTGRVFLPDGTPVTHCDVDIHYQHEIHLMEV